MTVRIAGGGIRARIDKATAIPPATTATIAEDRL